MHAQDSWEERWKNSDFSLHWTAEMFAYMFSAARLGIRHMMTDFLQDQPSHHKVRVAPVLHYSLSFKLSNGVSWGKGMPDADGEPLTQLLKATLPNDADEVVTGACFAIANIMHPPPHGHLVQRSSATCVNTVRLSHRGRLTSNG